MSTRHELSFNLMASGITKSLTSVTRATLGKKHVIQDFNYQETRWVSDIIIYNSLQSGCWGSMQQLELTYAKPFISCTDQEGITFDVVMEGELALPFEFTIVDESHPFTTSIALRRKL